MGKSDKYDDDDLFPLFFRRPSQKKIRLTEGEFDTSNHVLSSIGAQQLFLKTVRNLMPEVLEDLKSSCFEIYCSLGLHNCHWRVMPSVLVDLMECDARPEVSYLIPLREEIWSWSDRWNLGTDWCRERAFFTLVKWTTPLTQHTYTPEGDEKVTTLPPDFTEWGYGAHPTWIPEFEQEEFTFKWTWNPVYSLRSHVDAIARRIFEKQWREYLDKIEEQFVGKNKAKRSLNSPKQEHFKWLVMYQIKGMSAEEIFAQENPTAYAARKKDGSVSEYTKFIRKAYNKLAKLIYLPLRPDGVLPGRKSPSKT